MPRPLSWRGHKNFTRHLECQTIWVNNNKMFGLIWVKSLGKGNQQMPLVELSRPKDFSDISTCIESGLIFNFCLNTWERRQLKSFLTIDERGSNIARNRVSYDFLSTFVIFYCRLSGVLNLHLLLSFVWANRMAVMKLHRSSPPDKSVYWKFIFFISHPKHMLWVLKRTVSMRRFF